MSRRRVPVSARMRHLPDRWPKEGLLAQQTGGEKGRLRRRRRGGGAGAGGERDQQRDGQEGGAIHLLFLAVGLDWAGGCASLGSSGEPSGRLAGGAGGEGCGGAALGADGDGVWSSSWLQSIAST